MSGRGRANREEDRWVGGGDEPVGTSSRVRSNDEDTSSKNSEAKPNTAAADLKARKEDLREQLKQSSPKGGSSGKSGQIVIRTADGEVLVHDEEDEGEEGGRSGRRGRKRGGKKSKKSKKSRSSKRRKQHGE